MFLRPGKKHRQYGYTPRFYKPEEDQAQRVRKRIHFRSNSEQNSKSKRSRSIIVGVALILVILWAIMQLQQAGY